MLLPGNGIYVVRGEIATLTTAIRRGSRWNSSLHWNYDKEGLIKQFIDLRELLMRIEDIRNIEPMVFLGPFLDVIRTDETTGAVTSLALASVNKFLLYGLIDSSLPSLALTIENIVDAVTHARFMGTDQSSDGVTLYRVIEVLHTLIRSPQGQLLTNESVCEVMLSCFKICFEPRLNELLRRFAEQVLKDMVLMLFVRLPEFKDQDNPAQKKFQMMMEAVNSTNRRVILKTEDLSSNHGMSIKNDISFNTVQTQFTKDVNQFRNLHLKAIPLATTPATPGGNLFDMKGKITESPSTPLHPPSANTPVEECRASNEDENTDKITFMQTTTNLNSNEISEYINSVGVRFTQNSIVESIDAGKLVPYGLPCIQELFRFLVLLCNPLDKQNTDVMIHMGINLLSVAFEVGVDNIGKYGSLLAILKDELCRNLISLLDSERITIFAASTQLCFLIFESLRGELKFQMEAYLKKLSEIIANDNPKVPHEMREIALDNLLQLWRIPGFVAELYINYDCDLYCSDMFENLTNLLSKYMLSATNTLYNSHLVAMDTLLSVLEIIERNCYIDKNSKNEKATSRYPSRHREVEHQLIQHQNSVIAEENVPVISKYAHHPERKRSKSETEISMDITRRNLKDIKKKKILLMQGTELFNQQPEKGIQYLQDNGILNSTLDPKEIAMLLRENPGLDKRMIGEYISKKKNVDSKILKNFVDSFDFSNMRIDQALRLYLETFRLPGEAPLIFLVLEHFAERWHIQNKEPFENTDAAFSLAYAIIMLNMDQHNSNAKRLNIPMNQDDFIKNLRGLNGGTDFNQDMLTNVYKSIKNEEIIMPAEQTGIVKENYLWKVLLRRGMGSDGVFQSVYCNQYDLEVFNIIWKASLCALSFMFDKCDEKGFQRILSGFARSATIAANYNLYEEFDGLILTLCKFTTLLNMSQPETTFAIQIEITQVVNFGLNIKAQEATKTLFSLLHEFGDYLRESWKNILDIYYTLFAMKLLPKTLLEVDDFCEPSGKTTLILSKPNQRTESSIFSSLYSYLSSEVQREPSSEEQECIQIAKTCIIECQIEQLVPESKFLKMETLKQVLNCILALIEPPHDYEHSSQAYSENTVVFWMEMLVKIVIQNRDRIITLWSHVYDKMYVLLTYGAKYGFKYLVNRTIVAILKLAIYLMRNEEFCPIVLQSLKRLLVLNPSFLLEISTQISIGFYELLKTSAQNIHSEQDWTIVFHILETVGAGVDLDECKDLSLELKNSCLKLEKSAKVNSEKGYYSDPEAQESVNLLQKRNLNIPLSKASIENWIFVNKDKELSPRCASPLSSNSPITTLKYDCRLLEHSPFALFKCWDTLTFIVRNVAHVTPYNFQSCVRCIRCFVEAYCYTMHRELSYSTVDRRKSKLVSSEKKFTKADRVDIIPGRSSEGVAVDGHDCDLHDLAHRYETLAIQLLDLMYTLYTRTAQIFRWWAEEDSIIPQCSLLWEQGWCPLLQGIARLAMDYRREVRTHAISCLQQRALLVHDLQTLSGTEWASCFRKVLFPLLNDLLPESESVNLIDSILVEESRIRIATIMSKVFLHHLAPLLELGSAFNELWMEILDYIERFLAVGSDLLSEQMTEILKNLLLVMHSVRVFHNNDGTLREPLWRQTWDRINTFLPNFKNELFRNGEQSDIHTTSASAHQDDYRKEHKVINENLIESDKPRRTQKVTFYEISEKIKASPKPAVYNSFNQSAEEQRENMPTLIPPIWNNPIKMPEANCIFLNPEVNIDSQNKCIQAEDNSQSSLPDLVNDASRFSQNIGCHSSKNTFSAALDSDLKIFADNVKKQDISSNSSDYISSSETSKNAYDKPEKSVQNHIAEESNHNEHRANSSSHKSERIISLYVTEDSLMEKSVCSQSTLSLLEPKLLETEEKKEELIQPTTSPSYYFNKRTDPENIPPGSEMLYRLL